MFVNVRYFNFPNMAKWLRSTFVQIVLYWPSYPMPSFPAYLPVWAPSAQSSQWLPLIYIFLTQSSPLKSSAVTHDLMPPRPVCFRVRKSAILSQFLPKKKIINWLQCSMLLGLSWSQKRKQCVHYWRLWKKWDLHKSGYYLRCNW